MGVVYLARQEYPDREVALKVVAPELAADPAFRDRFIAEANAAASAEHPNIVPVHAAGIEDGTLYLAMRFVRAPTSQRRSRAVRCHPTGPSMCARRWGRRSARPTPAASSIGTSNPGTSSSTRPGTPT